MWLGAVASVVLAAGCLTKDPPEARFFDQHVQPILKNFCVGNTSPCHAIDQAIARDRAGQPGSDVVRGHPEATRRAQDLRQLSAPAAVAEVASRGGGRDPLPRQAVPERDSPRRRQADRGELRRLLRAQALARQRRQPGRHLARGRGRAPASATATSTLPPARPAAPGRHFDAGLPDLRRRWCSRSCCSSCAYGTCHSSPQADFYLTCGTSDEQIAFNYGQAAGFVVPSGTAVEQSETPAPAAVVAGGRRQPHGRRVLPVPR